MVMTRKSLPITLVIPDASPLLTLGRIRRLDLLDHFTVPIHVVDVVAEEAQRPRNDANGAVREWFARGSNTLTIKETTVGLGLAFRRARGEDPPTRNLGELAVQEYVLGLSHQGEGKVLPLILFEDPDVLELPVRKVAHVHLMNTATFLAGLQEAGLIADGADIMSEINGKRPTALLPFEKPGRTKAFKTTFMKSVGRSGRE